MALIGYARVSTAEQDTALQTDALRKAGCDKIFEDTVSGAKAKRPGLTAALAYVREGDTLTDTTFPAPGRWRGCDQACSWSKIFSLGAAPPNPRKG
jgi:hypothetical protein